ncbi:MAG: DNA polymerase IV [Verrucomicrobiota bacterium]
MQRSIIHLDMDCFYAAIEMRDQPALRGKPIGVGGARDRRGVLTTCNYEARKFGVRSAMPTFMALQRCPRLLILPTRFDVYRRESERVREIMRRYTNLIEPLSLDEAYLDVSAQPLPAGQLAREIRRRVLEETGLTASAGVGPNKLVAKIASDINKPDGQCEVRPEEVTAFIASLPVRKLPGIGDVAERKLAAGGITDCAQLQSLLPGELQQMFGRFGLELSEMSRGIDDRPVEPHRERKSLSTERTFSNDLQTLAEIEEKADALFDDLSADLAAHAATRQITKIFIKMKFIDFTRTTVERAGLRPERAAYWPLLCEAFARGEKHVRLLGLGVRFAPNEVCASQLPLF